MCVCHVLFFPSNASSEEYLGQGVHAQHLPGSNDRRALRPWQETGEAAWPGGSGEPMFSSVRAVGCGGLGLVLKDWVGV